MKQGIYFISSSLKGGDLTKKKNEIGFVPFVLLTYKGELEGSVLFFRWGVLFFKVHFSLVFLTFKK